MHSLPVTVGYWITESRNEKINFRRFQELCQQEGIQLTEIILEQDLERQGPFHVILHQGPALVGHLGGDLKEAAALISRFNLYLEKHPDTVLLDPIDAVRTISNRFEMCQLFKDKISFGNVHVPAYLCVERPADMENLKQNIKESSLVYPIVAKPTFAHDHNLMLLFNCDGLAELTKLRPPLILQQYIPHDGILYKINVIGRNVSMAVRPSLRNMTAEGSSEKTISFHTHGISKPGCTTELNPSKKETTSRISSELTSTALQIASRITAETSLSLFAVDMIVESGTRKHYIIDINYFPGFEETEEIPEKLLELTKESVKKSMEKQKQPSSDKENHSTHTAPSQ